MVTAVIIAQVSVVQHRAAGYASRMERKPALRLLVVEDNDDRVELFRAWLPDGFLLVHASSAGRALGILRRDRGTVYAGILLDHDLQGQAANDADRALSGTQVAELVAQNVDPRVPILVHSTNRTKGTSMVQALSAQGFDVEHQPMDELTRTAFLDWVRYVAEVWD